MKTSPKFFVCSFFLTVIITTCVISMTNAQTIDDKKSFRIITSFDGKVNDTILDLDNIGSGSIQFHTTDGTKEYIDSILGIHKLTMTNDSSNGMKSINISGVGGSIIQLNDDGELVSLDLDLEELMASINLGGILEGLEKGIQGLEVVKEDMNAKVIVKTIDSKDCKKRKHDDCDTFEDIKEITIKGDSENITIKRRGKKIIIKTSK